MLSIVENTQYIFPGWFKRQVTSNGYQNNMIYYDFIIINIPVCSDIAYVSPTQYILSYSTVTSKTLQHTFHVDA